MMKIIHEIFRPGPKILYFEPFFGCNYQCTFCIHGRGDEIETAQFGPQLFEKLKPVIDRVNHIHMAGLGEPFLNPHLLDYLSYFREKSKSYYICTNGSLIEDAHIELMAASKSELAVSLDAGDRETYGRVRRADGWDRVISCLEKASRVKAGRNRRYPLLYLTFHINALNFESLKKVPELTRSLRIDAVKLRWTILPEKHRESSVVGHKGTVEEVVRSLCKQLAEAGIHVINDAASCKHVRGCWDFGEMTFVGANGAVATCCTRWPTIGNIDDNRFEDIWNGAPRRRIALAVLNGRPEEACTGCPLIGGPDYERTEGFLMPEDSKILAEKSRSIGKLPSLEGLEETFRLGVAALKGGDHEGAVSVFSSLSAKFPDFFEIGNNLAVAHYCLGNFDKCREILDDVGRIPHFDRIVQANLNALPPAASSARKRQDAKS